MSMHPQIVFGQSIPSTMVDPTIAYWCGECAKSVKKQDDVPNLGCPHCGAGGSGVDDRYEQLDAQLESAIAELEAEVEEIESEIDVHESEIDILHRERSRADERLTALKNRAGRAPGMGRRPA